MSEKVLIPAALDFDESTVIEVNTAELTSAQGPTPPLNVNHP